MEDPGHLSPRAGNRGSGEHATARGGLFAEPERLDVVDSTNRYLADAARAGAPEGRVAVADEQTAGRGRLDRRWTAPAGSSLLCSFLFRPNVPTDRFFSLTALVALAAADACRAEGVAPDLKWPNDLVVDDRKLAGILAETVPAAGGAEISAPAVVVGLGLNVNWPEGWPPEDVPSEVAGLATSGVAMNRVLGRQIDREGLLASLLGGVGERYRALDAEHGWRSVMSEYRAMCATIGSPVRVSLADGTFSGRALEVTDDGSLLVDAGGRLRTVSAGDVVHLRPACHPLDLPH